MAEVLIFEENLAGLRAKDTMPTSLKSYTYPVPPLPQRSKLPAQRRPLPPAVTGRTTVTALRPLHIVVTPTYLSGAPLSSVQNHLPTYPGRRLGGRPPIRQGARTQSPPFLHGRDRSSARKCCRANALPRAT